MKTDEELIEKFKKIVISHYQKIADQVNLKSCEICNKSLNAKPGLNISSTFSGEPGLQMQFFIERHYLCVHEEFRKCVEKYIIEEINTFNKLFKAKNIIVS